MKPLTASQEAFARGVASGLSQAEAYRRAYPRSKGWKPEAVHVAGAKMAALGNVAERVASLQAAAADQAVLDGARVLREVALLAHSDIAGIMTEDGRVKLPHELDAATRAAVKSFEIDEYGRIKYQFWDKRASLDMAMKHLGLYREDNKQKGDPLVALLGRLGGNVIGPAAAGAEPEEG